MAMKSEVLLGAEAVALGAVHAGITAGYSYPGTTATQVMEYLIKLSQQRKEFTASWCVNEKVAYEEALGVSFAGKRTLVSMKHVGLNVAADPFMNSALIRVKGGLVVVVADDPGMHSSQNEQDSRIYADFARIMCFEPSNHQEAYDMTRFAFDVSEKWNIPLMIRLVTRISHSRSLIVPRPAREENRLEPAAGPEWMLLPSISRECFKTLVGNQAEFLKISNEAKFNSLTLGHDNRAVGVVAAGIGYNYVRENISEEPDNPSLLKICTYPLPVELISRLVEHVDTLLVVEEGYPFIERQIRGLFGIHGKTIKGKLSGHLPVTGELQPDTVRQAMEMEPLLRLKLDNVPLADRPPQLCQGCSHADTLKALRRAIQPYPGAAVFSDIGCYTLGVLPPLKAVLNTCVCMGASVSMAKGGADAGIYPAVGVIGDSTFCHSGITPLLDAAAVNSNMMLVIVDNASVAMTGGQETFLTGQGLVKVIEGVGVSPEHTRTITPLPKNLEENVQIFKEEIAYQGLSVIISTRECIQEIRKRKKKGTN